MSGLGGRRHDSPLVIEAVREPTCPGLSQGIRAALFECGEFAARPERTLGLAGSLIDGTSLSMDIIQATSPQMINEARRLFREYQAYLNVDLCFQKFELELKDLPGNYAPPSGVLLLAMKGQKAFGCGALRRFGNIADSTCEMKRLYVCPEARQLGVGRQIARRLIQEGVSLRYATMILDTLDRLKAALHLYESLGFVRTESYYDNPLPGVVFMKLDLGGI